MDPQNLPVQTFTYKTVNGLAIKADVCRPDDAVRRPAVMAIHGGALIMGSREWRDGRIRNPLLKSGYIYVSIDYRLAPECKLPDIIEDIEDAYTWILNEGPELFEVDPSALSVLGSSAGGYLSLTAGFRCTPRPAAVVSFYGYGGLIGDWYSCPSPHPRHHTSKISAAEAAAISKGPPVSDAHDRAGDGSAFYQHCRQHGTFPQAISGWDPVAEAEKFDPYMPIANVDSHYPPTLLIHGTADTDVPYEESAQMANALKRAGIEHDLLTIDNAEHGFEGGDEQQVDAAYRSALRFIENHVPTDGLPDAGA